MGEQKSLQELLATRATISVNEYAQLNGLSRNTVYARVADGTIPSTKLGERILIPISALG